MYWNNGNPALWAGFFIRRQPYGNIAEETVRLQTVPGTAEQYPLLGSRNSGIICPDPGNVRESPAEGSGINRLGKPKFLDTGCTECLGYLDARLKVYEKIAKGKREGGEDTCDEAQLYKYIKALRKDI